MLKRPPVLIAVILLVATLALGSAAWAQTKLLRFPHIHGDRVVFTYAGDLWIAPSSGGTATRLTAHPGLEIFARFSPDGEWIAFTGQYDGDEQVYVIPSRGGVPRQLTYYPARGPLPPRWGYDHQVYGWTPDGKAVLFRSLRDGWDLSQSRLYTVALEGGLPEALPMPGSGAGALSPDGSRVVYSPLFRDFRTWKRYQGGWAQDLWIFHLQTHDAQEITQHVRTERDPMWIGDKIYFAADWTGKLNLYAYDPERGETTQLTHHEEWDVRWPGADPGGQIVFELNGELRIYDTRTGEERQVPIFVPDDGVSSRPSRVAAKSLIEDFSLSPKGERALFVARGEVFTAPIEKGPTRNLTRTSGAHEKWARWSPDGARIAFISDASGEEEIWLVPQDGSAPPEQVTSGGTAMRYAPEWSPDGLRLAFSDKNGHLWVLTLADRRLVEVAKDPRGQVRDYTWSPDGAHLAFSLSGETPFRSLYIWSVADGELRKVTGDHFSEWSPAWDPEGNYLFYLSNREFAPQVSSVEWNYAGNRTTGIYALALRKDVPHPFPPESDEVTVEKPEPKKVSSGGNRKTGDQPRKGREKKSQEDETKPESKPVTIDFQGLDQRSTPVPVPAANYQGLSAKQGHLLYVSTGPFYYGRESHRKPALQIFSLEDRKETVLVEGISGYALSQDGSKVLVEKEDEYHLYDASPKGADSRKTVSTAGLQVDRIPQEEWAQIFHEVWRRFRDFFYVENLHGYDWVALREQYRPLLAHVGHRSDLNYLLGEMIAELNVSHAYIAGGDFQLPERPRVALPGARFELDRAAGRYRLARILEGQNEEERYRSPLTEVGVDVREGDYVLAIHGEELKASDNPYRLLRHKAGHPVRLTVNDRPTFDGAREVTFVPRTSESELLYFNWVTANRRKVAEATGGRVGYLHIPDMGADGIREFIKWFYPQIRKEGLVVDVRGNGGGNVSQMLIERLRRALLATGFSRTSEYPGTYPAQVFHGHLVCLLNETSASDGDIFPAMFRKAGLGPLIGKRSWGGVVGITNRGPLLDGGQVFVPEFGFASETGEWIIEGWGVEPDMVVENDPPAVLQGRDPQLERGIQEVLRRIEAEPRRLPERPPDPVKTE